MDYDSEQMVSLGSGSLETNIESQNTRERDISGLLLIGSLGSFVAIGTAAIIVHNYRPFFEQLYNSFMGR